MIDAQAWMAYLVGVMSGYFVRLMVEAWRSRP